MENVDKEFTAMQDIVKSLQGLDEEARERVLTYVFGRLGISLNSPAISTKYNTTTQIRPFESSELSIEQQGEGLITRAFKDIRTLKDEKNPATAVEMAVLVAYYLEELAPESEKKSEVETNDVTIYFKQAGYPLPKTPKMTLVHAKNAGYFESKDRGIFKLNPVGYNLAAYTMGKGEVKKPRAARKKVTKKPVTKKASKKIVTKPKGK